MEATRTGGSPSLDPGWKRPTHAKREVPPARRRVSPQGLGWVDPQSLKLLRRPPARNQISRAKPVGACMGKAVFSPSAMPPEDLAQAAASRFFSAPGGKGKDAAAAAKDRWQSAEEAMRLAQARVHPHKLHPLQHPSFLLSACDCGLSRGLGALHRSPPRSFAPQGLPNSDEFVPFTFLAATHQDTPLAALEAGRERLERDRADRLTQMKALVKENFDRFVRAKEDIDRVHQLLTDMEADTSDRGYSTQAMSARIRRIQAEADGILKPLLHFQGERDRIRLVLSLMRRYKPLFQLPSRIRHFARQGDVPRALREWCALHRMRFRGLIHLNPP